MKKWFVRLIDGWITRLIRKTNDLDTQIIEILNARKEKSPYGTKEYEISMDVECACPGVFSIFEVEYTIALLVSAGLIKRDHYGNYHPIDEVLPRITIKTTNA